MSHIPHIGGYSNAATEYQAYLERMRMARLEEQEAGSVKKKPTRTFDSLIDAEQEPEGDADQDQRGDRDETAEGEEKADSQPDGESHKYYA